jgi:iron(III) transport system permease protein
MNPALEEAGHASGATSLQTFRRITLPVLLPGILAPFILIALITLEQFELPLIIGLPARINVFSYRIYNELNPAGGLPNYGGAAAVSLPFLMLGFLALLLYNWITRESSKYVTVTGKAYRQKRYKLGGWAIPAYLFMAAYVTFAAVLPALTLLWTSLFGFRIPGVASWADASFSAYRSLLTDPIFWRAARNTLIVATASGLIVVALAFTVAWTVTRTRMFGRRALEALTFTSLGIPSVIVAFAVMVVYLSIPVGIYGTILILVLAYCYRMATVTRIARSSLMQIHKELEEAAATSGARWVSTQFRILLPLMTPALLSGFILMFIAGLREFTIPLVLYSQENVVLSVLLWQTFQGGQPAVTAALATLIIALVLPIIFLARRFMADR